MPQFTLAVSLAAICVLAVASAEGAITFLGPIPYLSKHDSPFSSQQGNPDFYLEDFEDGVFNTPGITDAYAIDGHSAVLNPSSLTDSVDGDDGHVDGSGTMGHSLISTFITFQLTDPRVNFRHFRFTFEENYFTSGHPNAFGFVWTDGSPGSTLRLRIFDVAGGLIEEQRFHGLGDSSHGGTTVEDRFFGVISDQGLGAVEITSIFFGDDRSFEIDHLQYGVMVPEVHSIQFTGLALLALIQRLRIGATTHSRRSVLLHPAVRSTQWKAEQYHEKNIWAVRAT